jgi:hypothetical protein
LPGTSLLLRRTQTTRTHPAMIQPRTYPELLAKALMLEPEPFAVMTHDDQPIIEGLVLTALVGVGVGVARTIGGLLFSWAMPPAAALEAAARQAAAMRMPNGVGIALPLPVESWTLFRLSAGYDTGWALLFSLIFAPFLMLVVWLAAGLLAYAVGRMAGGTGTLRQVLGASALVAAPAVLLLLTFIPFVAINPLLPIVWGLLILYRAMQSAHNMAWQTAAWATVIAAALLLAAGALLAGSVGALLVWL